MRHILLFTLLLLSYTSVVAQTVPTVWGNTRIPVRSPNNDSTGYASVSQLFSGYGSGLTWNVGGNTVTAHSVFGTNSNYDLIFNTNSTERMRLLAGGDLGLGIPNPIARLHIKATANSQAQIYVSNSAGTIVKGESVNSAGGFDAAYYNSSGTSYINFDGNVSQTRLNGAAYVGGYGLLTNGATLLNGGKTQIQGSGTTSATNSLAVHNSTGTNNGLIVRDDGNIGINTASPSTYLDVNGAVRIRTLASGASTDSIVTASAAGVLNRKTVTDFMTSSMRTGVIPLNGYDYSYSTFFRGDNNQLYLANYESGFTRTVNEGTDNAGLNNIFNLNSSVEINALKSVSNNIEVEYSFSAKINGSNSAWKTFVSFHSLAGSSGAGIQMWVKGASNGVWYQTMNTTITESLTISPNVSISPATGGITGIKFRITGITGTSYLKSIGAYSFTSSPYVHTVSKEGDFIAGTLKIGGYSDNPTAQFSNTGSSFVNALNGNFGVGTTSPSTKLHVNGDITLGNIAAASNILSRNGHATVASNNFLGDGYNFGGTGYFRTGLAFANATHFVMQRASAGAYTPNPSLQIQLSTGNVGIGFTSGATISDLLSVNGNTKTTNFQMTTGATNNYLLQSDASGNGTWVSPASVLSNASGWVNGGNSFGAIANIGTNDNFDLRFRTNSGTKMTLGANGFLGLATIAPQYKLDVYAGSEGNPIRAVGIQPSTNPLDSQIVIGTDGILRRAKNVIQTVSHYGATGDGSTNDATALQNAINTQQDVILEEGKTYVIGSQLNTTHKTHIYGNGATIKVISGDFAPILIDGDTSVIIENLNILHNKNASNYSMYSNAPSTYDIGSGISIKNGSHNAIIQNCRIQGHLNSGIVAIESNNLKIINNTISDGVAVYSTGADINLYNSCNNALIDGNTCQSNTSQGIAIGLGGGCDNVVITNNTCSPTNKNTTTNITRSGIMVGYTSPARGSGLVTITNNTIEDYGSAGMYLTESKIIASNNIVRRIGHDSRNLQGLRGGIVLLENQSANVSHNIIKNIYDAGSNNGDSLLIGGIVLASPSGNTHNIDMYQEAKISYNEIDSISGSGFVSYYKPISFTYDHNTSSNCKAWDMFINSEEQVLYKKVLNIENNKFYSKGLGGVKYTANYAAVSYSKVINFKDNQFLALNAAADGFYPVWYGVNDSTQFNFDGDEFKGYDRAMLVQWRLLDTINGITVKNCKFEGLTRVINHNVTSTAHQMIIFENCEYKNCSSLFFSDYNNVSGVGVRTGRNKVMYANSQEGGHTGLTMSTTPSFGKYNLGDKIINLDPSVKITEWACTNTGTAATAVFVGKVSTPIQNKITGFTGTTATFTGYNLPPLAPTSSIKIWKNGLLLEEGGGNDYTISASSPVTLTLATAAISGDKFILRIE